MHSIGLDLPTGILCIVMAFALSVLHILSSPKHRQWLSLPFYVRLGFFVSALGMLFRGVDLINLSQPSASTLTLGHIDPVGLALTASMAFTFCALALHALLSSMSPIIRERIERVEDLAHTKPHGEVLAALALEGFKVVPPMGKMPRDL